MWKLLHASAIGTSHLKAGTECQDASHASVVRNERGNFLVAACADGAGSAAWSGEGAKVACEMFATMATEALHDGFIAEEIAAAIPGWCGTIRARQAESASALGVTLRDMACTLLGVIASDNFAVCLQIGDGAIVTNGEDGFRWVFWPQSGEYANTTFFLSDENYLGSLQVRILHWPADEFALFTDGLERLILRCQEREVHGPAIEPMLAHLRAVDDGAVFSQALQGFLNSDGVNSRTDDDKTLILATRRSVTCNDGQSC